MTNTGPTTISGDVGVDPLTSVTGFPPGLYGGTLRVANGVSLQAQSDAATAYGVASGLTPTTSGLADLTGLTLVPGVYQGGVLSLAGDITLTGDANSVWVFQADSELDITGRVLLSGGATSCNVFWKVGTSATLHSGSSLVGAVLADQSITADTGALISGRLLARVGAVTLDTNSITMPTGCAPTGGPVITSGSPTSGARSVPYSFAIVAPGATSYAVTAGALPTGLALNSATGVIAGTPSLVGAFNFGVTVSNGAADASVTYVLAIDPAAGLAATGASDLGLPLLGASALLAAGLVLVRRKSGSALSAPLALARAHGKTRLK